jgi:hypothetical protein
VAVTVVAAYASLTAPAASEAGPEIASAWFTVKL